MLISTIASASFCFLCMTSGGAGDVAIDTVGPYYLDEIVVTATRYNIALRDLAATVSVVTEKDIEALNTCNSTDVLGILPGVFIHKTGTFGRADVDIRGIGDRGRSVMVLIDGRPVKMGLYGCTVTHSLPMDNVERIEVVRGPASVLYGSDALGGVINIITKKPHEKYEGDVIISYGNDNTQQYRVRTGGNFDKVHFYVTGDYRLSDGYVDNSAYDGKNFTGKFGYTIHESLDAIITGTYFDGYKEEPLRTTDPDSITADVWNDYKRWAVDLTMTGRWHTFGYMAKAYRNYGEHTFSDGWHSKDYTNGCIVQGSATFVTGNTLSIGGDFRQQGGRKIATEVQPDTGHWQKNEYGIFVHDEQLLFDRLMVTFGARYNRDEVAGDDISPQIGCVLHLTDGTIIRGLVSKGFRSPQINELYLFPSSNTDLEPEVVWNYEVGLNQRIIPGLNVEATAFLMKGKNLIELGQNSEPPPLYVFKNTGTFEFRGMEVGVIGTLNNIISARVYHSYLDPQEKTTGKPQHKTDGTVLLSYAALGFSLNGQYITDYYAADSSREAIPDYAVVNTKVTYQLPFGLQPFCAIDNIFDEDYEIYANLPGGSAGLYKMPGRTFTIGAQYKF